MPLSADAEDSAANVAWALAPQELGSLGMCFHKGSLTRFLSSRMQDKMAGELQAQENDNLIQKKPLRLVLYNYFPFFQASKKIRTKFEDQAQHLRPLQSTNLWSSVRRRGRTGQCLRVQIPVSNWFQVLALRLTTYVTLSIIFNLSEPQFPIPQQEDDNSTCLKGLF